MWPRWKFVAMVVTGKVLEEISCLSNVYILNPMIVNNIFTYTVKTAVLFYELNRHITHLMQCVLPEMRAQYELIQHVLAALPMVHTFKRVFFTAYTTTHLMCVQSMRESRINTL